MVRAAVIALAACWLLAPAPASAAKSKDVLEASRQGQTGGVQVEQREKMLAIEICSDSCDYFVARRVKSDDEVWDAILLHQAYFHEGAGAKTFRVKNSAHVSYIMAAYADKCAKYPQDATRATCIVKYLGGRNRIDYAHVRYQGGNRCETAGELLAQAVPSSKEKCMPAKNQR